VAAEEPDLGSFAGFAGFVKWVGVFSTGDFVARTDLAEAKVLAVGADGAGDPVAFVVRNGHDCERIDEVLFGNGLDNLGVSTTLCWGHRRLAEADSPGDYGDRPKQKHLGVRPKRWSHTGSRVSLLLDFVKSLSLLETGGSTCRRRPGKIRRMPHGFNGMSGPPPELVGPPPAPSDPVLPAFSILPPDFAPPPLIQSYPGPSAGPGQQLRRAPERGPGGPMFGGPPSPRQGGQMMRQPPPPMYQQAVGDIPNERAHMLGLSVVGLGVGASVGVKYGGLYGGIAGGLFAGALVNAYRAVHYYKEGSESDDKEAMASGTYAVISGALGALLWTKFAKTNSAIPNTSAEGDGDDDDDDDDDEPVVGAKCGIRPVGP
jgi:hypothetical protein